MKRKLFLTLGLVALTMYSYGAKKPKTTARKMNKTTIQQPTFTEWHDLQVNEINRLPLHTSFFTYPFADMVYEEGGVVKSRNLSSVDKTMSQNFLSLDGIWKFKWVEISILPTSMTLIGARFLFLATGNSTAMVSRSM